MAGVGETAAIVGLITTAASLSKAVVSIASKYKIARLQIESFGQEVGNLGNILGQLHQLYSKDDLQSGESVISVTADILDQCSGLFAVLETYRDTLYSGRGSARKVNFRGKTKWIFEEKELEYLRTRVESMKLNMLLMMTMQYVHGLHRYRQRRLLFYHKLTQYLRSNVGGTFDNHAEQARILSIQSEGCAKRLQSLENDVALPTSTDANPLIRRTSIDTTASARSILDSILSLYGHESLYERPPESQAEVLETGSMQVDQTRVSRIIDDQIRISAVVDEDGLDSPRRLPDTPLILPNSPLVLLASPLILPDPAIISSISPLTLPCSSLESSTASNDEAIGDLEVGHFDHLAATEPGISTESHKNSSDQHQYDSTQIVPGYFGNYPWRYAQGIPFGGPSFCLPVF